MKKYGISDIIDQKLREIKCLSLKMRDLIHKAGERSSSAERDRLLSFENTLKEFKDRARELENENCDLVKFNTELIQKLEAERLEFRDQLEKKSAELEKFEFQNKLNQEKVAVLENECKISQRIQNERSEIENQQSIEQFHHLNIRFSHMETERNQLLCEKKNLEKTILELRETLENREKSIQVLQNQHEEHIFTLSDQKNAIKSLKSENLELREEIRRIKGQISVFCRIKPIETSLPQHQYKINATETTLSINKNEFNFDSILFPGSTQTDVFENFSHMIDAVTSGYNTCIFAYGQTGSGKTYTMEGSSSNPGIIPQALKQIFLKKNEFSEESVKIELNASIFEIYNENILDLIDTSPKKCEVRHTQNETQITNCAKITINSFEDAQNLLRTASENRSVASTQCNLRSSRSHLVFHLHINYLDEVKNEKRNGTLTLIDLAGSERLNESKAEGDRLKETKSINQSLSALGNVIHALAQKNAHIPFRSSKLTYFLQNYMSGKSFVSMIVNISSELRHMNETICSLRFAEKVNRCVIGKQSRNIAVNIS